MKHNKNLTTLTMNNGRPPRLRHPVDNEKVNSNNSIHDTSIQSHIHL